MLGMVLLAGAGYGQEMPEGRLMRFPDIYKDRIVFTYAGDPGWLPVRVATRGASPRTPDANCSQSFHLTANGSPSPDNMMAISTSA